MWKTKKLSVNQEIKLLRQLKSAYILGAGSSRLTVIDPRDSQKVVKIAIGNCSFMQNKSEIKLWLDSQNDHLARIFEYGRFCVVMERAQLVVDGDDDFEENIAHSEESEEAEEVVNWLTDVVTYSSDNYQIGKMPDGRWASYDYGFRPGISVWIQCGWADSINRNRELLHRYIDTAIKMLRDKTPITKIDQLTRGLGE